MKFQYRKVKAFTLIELLVVCGIIAVLASVVIISLESSRAKSRDTKVISDVTAITTALDLYVTDKGYYPNNTISGFAGNGDSNMIYNYDVDQWNSLRNILSNYISVFPPYGNSEHFIRYTNLADAHATPICKDRGVEHFQILASLETSVGNAAANWDSNCVVDDGDQVAFANNTHYLIRR